jgi:DNA-binding CsgD family transcriptional regulator
VPPRNRSSATLRGRTGARLLADMALDALSQEGELARAVDLAHQALAMQPIDAGVVLTATMVLRSTDDLDAPLAACDAGLESARRRGSMQDFGACSLNRAFVLHQRGNLADAEVDARRADETAEEIESDLARRYTQAALLPVLIDRGGLAEAEDTLSRSGVATTLAYLLAARGRLRLAQGRPAEAVDDLRACGVRLARRGIRHPGLIPWQPEAALAAHGLGDDALAAELLDEAEDLARRYEASRPLGMALRARGIVEDRIDRLAQAVSILRATPARLEHARAVVELGAALRRDNQRTAAGEQLRLGLDLAHRCGAHPLVARAQEELACLGARVRRLAVAGVDALTPSERRVAQLAAQGLSNRDVAQALFVSTKTVETHLGSAYRKLGITGRHELGAAPA